MIVIWRDRDTFERLAARWLGDWTLGPFIRDRNGIGAIDPDAYTRIEIPDDFPGAEQKYLVQDGDSWESVSALHYGSERGSERIRNANPGSHIYERVGEKIIVPALINTSKVKRLRSA